MFCITDNSTRTQPCTTNSILQAARIAALSLPLAGCAGQYLSSVDHTPSLQRQHAFAPSVPPDPFDAPPGMGLAGFEFVRDSLYPRFEPLNSASLLSAEETQYVRSVLDPQGELTAEAVQRLPAGSLGRLEPVVLHVALFARSTSAARAGHEMLLDALSEHAVESLCDLLQSCRGQSLERAIALVTTRPTDKVHTAMRRAIFSSGYLESEARDDSMALGCALARLSPRGRELITDLLNDPDERMQLAGAVSLTSINDAAALPTLLRFASHDELGYAKEAIAYLPQFSECPEILPPLEAAVARKELSQDALLALREVGHQALPLLIPFADVGCFLASGIERTGRNPFLPGIAYGEVIETIQACRESEPNRSAAQPFISDKALDTLLAAGIPKMIADLNRPQLSADATSGLRALGALVHPYIPQLIHYPTANPLLLSYPTSTLLTGLGSFLNTEELSANTIESSDLLAQQIRALPSSQERQDTLVMVLDQFSDAPWLRHLLSQCWREDTDASWASAALQSAAPSAFTCGVGSEIEQAAKHGITIPFRWSPENLAEILRNRSATTFDGRPIATMVYARSDYNGAFAQHNSLIRSLIDSDYCVMYFEASTDLEVLQAMQRAITRPSESRTQPSAFLILAAHSSRTEMNFGRADNPSARVDCGDLDLFIQNKAADTFRPYTQAVLIACSAGEGRDTKENIANMFRAIFPTMKEHGIWASEVPDNVRGFIFDPASLELSDVLFHYGRIYRP